MTSEWKGYTILHDRTGAQEWKGDYDPSRPADIVGSDLAAVIEHIDVLKAHEKEPDVIVEI